MTDCDFSHTSTGLDVKYAETRGGYIHDSRSPPATRSPGHHYNHQTTSKHSPPSHQNPPKPPMPPIPPITLTTTTHHTPHTTHHTSHAACHLPPLAMRPTSIPMPPTTCHHPSSPAIPIIPCLPCSIPFRWRVACLFVSAAVQFRNIIMGNTSRGALTVSWNYSVVRPQQHCSKTDCFAFVFLVVVLILLHCIALWLAGERELRRRGPQQHQPELQGINCYCLTGFPFSPLLDTRTPVTCRRVRGRRHAPYVVRLSTSFLQKLN